MAKAIEETDRRREKQVAYNLARGVDPQPLRKKIADITDDIMREEEDTAKLIEENRGKSSNKLKSGQSASATKGRKGIAGKAYDEILSVVIDLENQMKAAAAELQFELAARIRDEMVELKRELRQMEAAGHVDKV
jgi:excinuclease ABC subunit B